MKITKSDSAETIDLVLEAFMLSGMRVAFGGTGIGRLREQLALWGDGSGHGNTRFDAELVDRTLRHCVVREDGATGLVADYASAERSR